LSANIRDTITLKTGMTNAMVTTGERMTAFDDSLVLDAVSPGVFKSHADSGFQGANGMFGGWLTALMLKSVGESEGAEGTASALTVNFIKGVQAGAGLTLRTGRLGGGRSLAHWRCDLYAEDESEIAVTAIIVLASRSQSDRHCEARMPDAQAPETLSLSHPPSKMGEHVDSRRALGDPSQVQDSTRSWMWLRDMSQRPLDVFQLVSQCDNLPPRINLIREGRRPSPTLTMTIYIHATDEELATVGGDFILSEVVGTRIEHSTSGSRSNLWSRSGVLLATSEQLQWFK
jgi:acyl-CoA thioesterase